MSRRALVRAVGAHHPHADALGAGHDVGVGDDEPGGVHEDTRPRALLAGEEARAVSGAAVGEGHVADEDLHHRGRHLAGELTEGGVEVAQRGQGCAVELGGDRTCGRQRDDDREDEAARQPGSSHERTSSRMRHRQNDDSTTTEQHGTTRNNTEQHGTTLPPPRLAGNDG